MESAQTEANKQLRKEFEGLVTPGAGSGPVTSLGATGPVDDALFGHVTLVTQEDLKGGEIMKIKSKGSWSWLACCLAPKAKSN